MSSNISWHRLPHEKDTTERDHGACATQQFLAPCPSVHGADADPHRVQTACRDHEAHAVKQGALTWREFCSVRVAMAPARYGRPGHALRVATPTNQAVIMGRG